VPLEEDLYFKAVDLAVESEEVDPGGEVEIKFPVSDDGETSGILWWGRQGDVSHEHSEVETVLDKIVRSTEEVGDTEEAAGPLPIAGPFQALSGTRTLTAPEEAGDYVLNLLLRDENGAFSFASREIGVNAVARWEALTPPRIRLGDRFWAGVRFWPDPELTVATGLTTSVLLSSTLLPETYFTTAALVKPGDQGDMLFEYQAPAVIGPKNEDGFLLKYELGVEGVAHAVETKLKPIPTKTREYVVREHVLEPGEAMRLNLDLVDQWRVRLFQEKVGEAGDSSLDVLGFSREAGSVSLTPDNPVQEYVGSSGGKVEIRHLSGSPVRVRLSELKEDHGPPANKAKTVYLMRTLTTKDGTGLNDLRLDKGGEYRMVFHLVISQDLEAANLSVPLPGGIRATGCWQAGVSEQKALPWTRTEEGLSVRLPSLRAGEHQVFVTCEAVVDGIYDWPQTMLLNSAGEVESTSRTGRVSIE
jgi:hypothetical protein